MGKVRTMIVDDNSFFQESLVSFFANHEEIDVVGSVTSGHECLDRIRDTPIDLIIMDVRMSGIDRPQTTTIIK